MFVVFSVVFVLVENTLHPSGIVQRIDNAVHLTNHYPMDKVLEKGYYYSYQNQMRYSVFLRLHYPLFEDLRYIHVLDYSLHLAQSVTLALSRDVAKPIT